MSIIVKVKAWLGLELPKVEHAIASLTGAVQHLEAVAAAHAEADSRKLIAIAKLDAERAVHQAEVVWATSVVGNLRKLFGERPTVKTALSANIALAVAVAPASLIDDKTQAVVTANPVSGKGSYDPPPVDAVTKA